MKKYAMLLVILIFAAQWAVPVMMIVQQETVLRKGVTYRFRTAPVDPYDAFRGRYVRLQFPNAMFASSNLSVNVTRGQRVFVRVEQGSDGFAQLVDLADAPPQDGDYLRLKVSSTHSGQVWVRLPFDRFYMEESEAPEAERLQPTFREREERDAWASVQLYKGRAVLEDVYVDGKPIRERVREERMKVREER